jgi:hypothetical protein
MRLENELFASGQIIETRSKRKRSGSSPEFLQVEKRYEATHLFAVSGKSNSKLQ